MRCAYSPSAVTSLRLPRPTQRRFTSHHILTRRISHLAQPTKHTRITFSARHGPYPLPPSVSGCGPTALTCTRSPAVVVNVRPARLGEPPGRSLQVRCLLSLSQALPLAVADRAPVLILPPLPPNTTSSGMSLPASNSLLRYAALGSTQPDHEAVGGRRAARRRHEPAGREHLPRGDWRFVARLSILSDLLELDLGPASDRKSVV